MKNVVSMIYDELGLCSTLNGLFSLSCFNPGHPDFKHSLSNIEY
jgi:hypothetical protein